MNEGGVVPVNCGYFISTSMYTVYQKCHYFVSL